MTAMDRRSASFLPVVGIVKGAGDEVKDATPADMILRSVSAATHAGLIARR